MPEHLVHRVSFRDTDHTYHLDGKRIPSVTTILGVINKPALVPWAANMAADAVRDWLHNEIVEHDGRYFIGADEADDLHTIARTAHTKRKTAAGAKGSVVHDAIQQYHEDFFNADPPEDPEARRAWRAFVAWWATSNLDAVAVERKVAGPEGRYAGRCDLIARDRDTGRIIVCDIKTSNRPYTEALMQNAAYAYAYAWETGETIGGTQVLWLPAGCTKLTAIVRDDLEWYDDYDAFCTAFELYRYKKRMDPQLHNTYLEHRPNPDTTETTS